MAGTHRDQVSGTISIFPLCLVKGGCCYNIYDCIKPDGITAVTVKELDNFEGYAAEGKPDSKKAQEYKSEHQLLANMSKASAMVAMTTIKRKQHFKKVAVS